MFELSRRMPPDQKMRVLREKSILKRTFRHDLPAAIVARTKYPYRAPDALALYRGPQRQPLLELIKLQRLHQSMMSLLKTLSPRPRSRDYRFEYSFYCLCNFCIRL